MFKIDLQGGKYTYINDNGVQSALRDGQPWRKEDLVGDNLILAMGQKIEELQNELNYDKVIKQVMRQGYFSREDIQQLLSCKPEKCEYINIKELFTKMEGGYKLPTWLFERSYKTGLILPCKHEDTSTEPVYVQSKGFVDIKKCEDCWEEV